MRSSRAVASDAPAAAKLDAGDVIVAARGKPILHPGPAPRRVQRRPSRRQRRAPRPARRPARDGDGANGRVAAEKGRAIIGILVAQAADIKLPVKVDINLGRVGGPSAGLPFALDVLQELGTNVDQGRKVVATGEIALDGTVGPIGGVKQKTFGARKAGADVFLVPAGENAAEARRYAGNLRIIPVESFQQALSALRTLPSK